MIQEDEATEKESPTEDEAAIQEARTVWHPAFYQAM
jgi:hypothetical protein